MKWLDGVIKCQSGEDMYSEIKIVEGPAQLLLGGPVANDVDCNLHHNNRKQSTFLNCCDKSLSESAVHTSLRECKFLMIFIVREYHQEPLGVVSPRNN